MTTIKNDFATNYQNPLDAFASHAARHPDKAFLYQPVNRQWQVTSWQEAFVTAKTIAAGLQAIGLVKGDRVAILSKNCAEWFLADFAMMMAGLISVPIYTTANESTIRFAIENSDCKAIFVGKLDDKTVAGNAVSSLSGEQKVKVIAMPYETIDADYQWNDWLNTYQPLATMNTPLPDETMTIVYTSGSTGDPKGVVTTYKNFSAVCQTNSDFFNLSENDRFLSYLPLAHITERAVVEGPGLYAGICFYFVESLETFIDDLKYARPTLFLSVPRLWTRFQSGVFEKISAKKLDGLLAIPFLGKLIARKIRESLGLNSVRIFGSGTAPISPSILAWYHKIGIDISEGWGMTETTGLSCCSHPFAVSKMGTIGTNLSCIEMKLSEVGEILVRGDALFKEYYKNPAATQHSFTNGWFKTGDKACLQADGNFRIIGRVKDAFKTAKGKYVSPVQIESLIAANSDIEQICVMGSGRKQPVAVVVLAEHLQKAASAAIKKSLSDTLEKVNAVLEKHQQLDYLIVSTESWSIENECLTPTLKIRRSVLEARYQQLVEKILPEKVYWEDELVG